MDISSTSYRVLSQLNQSDLAFLRQCARDIDAEVWISGSELHIQTRSRRDQGEVSLTYGQTLREFSVMADLAEQRTAVSVSGWDIAAKESIVEVADETSIANELGSDISGANLLKAQFGERVERIVHSAPLVNEEATNIAKAYFGRISRRFVTGHALARETTR